MEKQKMPNNCINYYITGSGRIWGVQKEELVNGEAQSRRNIIGNSFKTAKEASLAKAKLEAIHRLAPYAEKEYKIVDGVPAITIKFFCNEDNKETVRNDVRLLAESCTDW